jgi:putative peptidoglycan lipid II flippase
MTTIRAMLDRFLPRGALVLSILSFAYFAMGLVRNRVFAQTFGAGAELDAYNAAIRVPEIALDVLVAAGLTAPFVPIFSALRQRDETAANQFGRTVLTAATLVMAVALGVLFLAAPLIADAAVSGFDPAGRGLYVDLMRINCLGQLFFAASICLGEVLVAHRRFAFYALAPIFYSGGIVVATILFGRQYGVYATTWGGVAGAVAHFGVRAIGTTRTSFRIRPALAIRTEAFREFVRLMLPRMASFPIEPLMFTFFASLASQIGPGSVSSLNFASDFQVVPVSLIGVSFSLAVFPTLSAAFAAGDRGEFRTTLVRNVATIGALTTIAAVALFILGEFGIRLLLGGGRFSDDDIARTSLVLAAFSLSVPFDSLSYPLSRALYATRNTLLQVAASFVGFGTIVVAALVLVPGLGIVAIPLAYALGSAIKVVVLTGFLIPRVRRIGGQESAAPDSG